MKKALIIIMCAALLFGLAACAGKNVKVKAEAFEMTREELAEALDGAKEEDLVAWWGDPSSYLSGLYGSIWTHEGKFILVYFDGGYEGSTAAVMDVICGEPDENGFISE